jgi:hypothetical protein
MRDIQRPDKIVPHKSTSTTLRNTPLTYKHDSAGSLSITGNQRNRVYVRAKMERLMVEGFKIPDSPINREFYLAKGTEKFILGR